VRSASLWIFSPQPSALLPYPIPPLMPMTCPLIYPAAAEHNQCGDFRRRAGAPGRDELADLFRIECRVGQRAGDHAGRNDVDRNAARCHLARQRFRRAMQRRFRGGVVGLAAVAEHGRDRRHADDAAEAHARHRQQQRLDGMEETVQRHVDHAMPLLLAHAGQRRIVVDAGVVHEHADRSAFEQRFDRRARRRTVGQVEAYCVCLAAGRADFSDDGVGALCVRVRVHVNRAALGREFTTDRRADVAAAAGDERADRLVRWGLCHDGIFARSQRRN